MSRIGKKIIPVPDKAKVSVAGDTVTVESGGKKLTHRVPSGVAVAFDAGAKAVRVTIADESKDDRQARANWGSTRAIVSNMITGVTTGFERVLEVNGVGWGAVVGGKTLDLKLGYANLIKVPIPAGLEVTVDKSLIRIKGADKQAVGQLASVVRSKRKPEPYNAKGVKYQEEVIKRKQGKAFGA